MASILSRPQSVKTCDDEVILKFDVKVICIWLTPPKIYGMIFMKLYKCHWKFISLDQIQLDITRQKSSHYQ